MLSTIRRRPFALAALLLLLAAVSVDLCRHGGEGAALPAAAAATVAATAPLATGLACDDCGDCCDGGPVGEADHCHACSCACHALGILTAADGGQELPAATPHAGRSRAQRPAGFAAAFERPPLAS